MLHESDSDKERERRRDFATKSNHPISSSWLEVDSKNGQSHRPTALHKPDIIFKLVRCRPYTSIDTCIDRLAQSSYLADCRKRVQDAGCELFPSFTRCLCLAPITEDFYGEMGFKLQRHHILALGDDHDLIMKALKTEP